MVERLLLEEPSVEASLNVEFYCRSSKNGAAVQVNLANVDTYVGTCMKTCASGKLFSFSIPDPKTINEDPEDRSSEHLIKAILLYFPFNDGSETTPQRSSYSLGAVSTDLEEYYAAPVISGNHRSSSSSGGARVGLSQGNALVGTQHGTVDAPILIDQDSVIDTDEDVFSVLWQNRLVPDTTVQRLPCFPFREEKLQADVSEHWKKRVKGFLFLDWKFEYISNNKLQIQVTPSFAKFLNSKEIRSAISYQPREMRQNLIS